jgi:hypothetical protein
MSAADILLNSLCIKPITAYIIICVRLCVVVGDIFPFLSSPSSVVLVVKGGAMFLVVVDGGVVHSYIIFPFVTNEIVHFLYIRNTVLLLETKLKTHLFQIHDVLFPTYVPIHQKQGYASRSKHRTKSCCAPDSVVLLVLVLLVLLRLSLLLLLLLLMLIVVALPTFQLILLLLLALVVGVVPLFAFRLKNNPQRQQKTRHPRSYR